MDLRAGIRVPITSVPFQLPVFDKEGKYPLRDVRYYYIIMRSHQQGNVLQTRLFICHSGFLFSIKLQHCIPVFLHEYVLAGSSYRLGVDLASQANMNLEGGKAIGSNEVANAKPPTIARLSVGKSTGVVLKDPKAVFGTVVPLELVPFELEPCSEPGYFATPDYRYYYVCVEKPSNSPDTADDQNNDNEDTEDDDGGDEGSDTPGNELANPEDDGGDGDDNNLVQTAYMCIEDLYFSEFFGFCVAPYIHQHVGLNRLELYIWRSHKLRESVLDEGYLIQYAWIPWEIPPCSKDGKFPIRDPRYYILCQGGLQRIYMCPSNLYFNSQLQRCVPIKDCDCWYKIGYLIDPFPKNGQGQEFNIFIHLDRAYLRLLRQAMIPIVRRSVRAGQYDGRTAALLQNLICFWREMEKLRTLQYSNTSPQRGQMPRGKRSLVTGRSKR